LAKRGQQSGNRKTKAKAKPAGELNRALLGKTKAKKHPTPGTRPGDAKVCPTTGEGESEKTSQATQEPGRRTSGEAKSQHLRGSKRTLEPRRKES